MKKILGLLLTLTLTIQFSYIYAQEETWWKGNLHTHSYWSDGDHFPEMILRWYVEHDYDFLALSEHNIIANVEKWVNLRKRRHGSRAFIQYLDAYGEDWVHYKIVAGDTLVKLKTYEEYAPLFEKPGEFLIIPSEEITDKYKDKPVHINATNVQELIQPQSGRTIVQVMQNNIDQVLAQRERTGIPMIPHINHPNFGWAMTARDLIKLEGERFFELYNGHPAVHNYGDDERSGIEEMWDDILTAYVKKEKLPMYGIAVDDAHNYHNMGLKFSNTGRGWIMVKTADLRPASIIEAMEAGHFYATTGVTLRQVKQHNGTLSVSIQSEDDVSYKIQFIASTNKDAGVIMAETEGTEASYNFTGEELYVRIKIISDKPKTNPYKEWETEVAWTQPFYPGGEIEL